MNMVQGSRGAEHMDNGLDVQKRSRKEMAPDVGGNVSGWPQFPKGVGDSMTMVFYMQWSCFVGLH